MRILVYGAGVLGSLHAALLHEAGLDVTLVARGDRLMVIRDRGVLIAEGDHGAVRSVPVPVVDGPAGDWDLTLVLVRAHQVDAVLESLAEQKGDVLLLVNWAAGPEPLAEIIGQDRILLGFPARGGVMDGDVVRFRPASRLTRLVRMPIGEPDGRTTPRVERIIETFDAAGFSTKVERRMDAWLRTHAAFEVPLGLAVHAAGGPDALSDDRGAIRWMVHEMKRRLAAMSTPAVPGPFRLLRILPESLLVPVFSRFLRSEAAVPLRTDSPAVMRELDLLSEQLRETALERFAGQDR